DTAEPQVAAATVGNRAVLRSSARADAITAFLIRCASAALLYLAQVALARWMGATEYGIYVSVWTAIMIAGGVATLGLNLGVMRLVPVHREAGQLDYLRGLVVGSRVIAFVLGTGIAVAGYLLLGFVAMSDTHRAATSIALMCLPFYAVSDMQDGLGRGHGWILPALLPPYVLRPLLLVLAMTVAGLAGFAMRAETAAVAIVMAVAVGAVLQSGWLHARFKASHGTGQRRYAPRAWVSSSLPLLAIAGAELALQNTDVMVLARYVPPAEVAIYFAAAKTMALVMFVHYAVGSAMASRFAGLKERGDMAGLQTAVRDAVGWTFWPSLALAALLVLLGRPILALFGPGFSDAYPVMTILVAGFLLRSAMGPAEILLNMLGEQRVCAAIMLSGAVVSIILNLLLVPIYGTLGAAVATAIALGLVGLLNGFVAEQRTGLRIAIWRHFT
ncbi:MAG: lipopolysaccharide biosynthesis protein, partial [Hyphomicrobiaceae bacterium]|nr:lipopolysaccharide biosynthesis protein [Hyphomicrobiaceae bacterium]